ncbi:hypothetical protein SLEP1_g3392 [Rubroshorea leprosula]|uniref:Uncharacterized protein n=1 Tax=Rubroshorea leprosula TaxID=152421 RepID=A0AAV5HUU2_9ROSI|nr:hypothetical protein SLEP1_g3392 [Rubroshorea leprosula]
MNPAITNAPTFEIENFPDLLSSSSFATGCCWWSLWKPANFSTSSSPYLPAPALLAENFW